MYKLLFTFVLFLIFSQTNAYSHRILDSLFEAKAKELGLKKVTIKIVQGTDTTLNKIIELNQKGQQTSLGYSYTGKFQTSHFRYNEEGKRIEQINFKSKDTTNFSRRYEWKFIDSSHYFQLIYDQQNELIKRSRFNILKQGDTSLIHQYDYPHPLSEISQLTKTSRYINKADSLLQIEFIHYDNDEKIKNIEAYYKLFMDSESNMIVHYGSLFLNPGTVPNDEKLMEDFYTNPEKYYQLQLNGGFEYEIGEIYEIKKFNEKGQLIYQSSGNSQPFTTYLYQDDQLIEESHTGKSGFDNQLQVLETSSYIYLTNGLPERINTSMHDGRSKYTLFEYEFH